MKNITFRQLRYFQVLVEQRHFGRAAAVCSISQPALSRQIKELEAEVGQPLFERRAREIRLTGFAEEFAQRVKVILRDMDELGDFARSRSAALVGRFRIGVIPTIAPYLLPKLLSQLTKSHSTIDLHIRETLTPRLLHELDAGKIDCAIVALPISEPSLEEIALFSEDFVFVRPASDQGQPVPSGRELGDMRLLLLEEGHCFRDQALAFCERPPAKVPRGGLDGSSLSTLVQMVGAGIGVTVIPAMAVAVEARSAAVSCVPFRAPQPQRTVGMVWRKTNPMSAQFMEIAEVVRLSAQRIGGIAEGPSIRSL